MTKYIFMSALLFAGFQLRANEARVNAEGLYNAEDLTQVMSDEQTATPLEIMFDGGRGGGGGHGGGNGGGHGGGDHGGGWPGGGHGGGHGGGDHGGGWPGGGHGGGHGGGWPPHPGPRWFTCYAQDGRGRSYAATARNPNVAQQEAMNACYQRARFCREQGCN